MKAASKVAEIFARFKPASFMHAGAPYKVPGGEGVLTPRLKEATRAVVALGGTSLCLSMGYKTFHFLTTIPFVDPVATAFAGGLITAASCGGVLLLSSRLFLLGPETVFRAAMRRVKDDRKVIEVLGGPLRPAAFRAYSFDNANFTIDNFKFSQLREEPLAAFKSFYKPRQFQVLFQVQGARGNAIVSAEAERKGSSLQFNSLAVDILSSGERILLEGTLDKNVYRGHIRLR